MLPGKWQEEGKGLTNLSGLNILMKKEKYILYFRNLLTLIEAKLNPRISKVTGMMYKVAVVNSSQEGSLE